MLDSLLQSGALSLILLLRPLCALTVLLLSDGRCGMPFPPSVCSNSIAVAARRRRQKLHYALLCAPQGESSAMTCPSAWWTSCPR